MKKLTADEIKNLREKGAEFLDENGKPIHNLLVRRMEFKPKPIVSEEKTDPVADALNALVEQLKVNALVSDANAQRIIGETIDALRQGVKDLKENHGKRRWHFSATRTANGFDIEATEK